VRIVVIGFLFTLLTACASGPSAADRDGAREPWYSEATQQLAAINRQAETFFQNGNSDKAAALIERGQSLQSRLVAVPRPTLEAMEAASDLDDLYGRMLLSNRHYGWARLFFQKNVARWKHWSPRTPETERRLQQANAAIEECDRRIGE
jgi:hypothetical protein